MQTRKIGSLSVSVVGLGCNNFGGRLDAEGTARVVHAALDAGVNFFDTADIYGGTKSEEFLGQALKGRRDQAIIATKFAGNVAEGKEGARPEYIRKACDDSLRRLGVDCIDLYQQHRPDPNTPIPETLDALNELVAAGKVREIGCSNFTAQMLRDAEAAVKPGAARFVSVQNHYSLLQREDEQEALPECERLGLAYLPYFPLANGLLTGKFRQGQSAPEGTRLGPGGWAHGQLTDERLALAEKLIAFAESRGRTILELAFGGLLSRGVVASVIAGATSPEQIRTNASAASWKLSEEDLKAVDAILAG
jgi:aryl-alcohol dehydrogenase-like predicted oxidoreductase